MIDQNFQFILFLVQLGLVYFISQATIREFFAGLRRFIKNDHTVALIVSFIYFPGTIIHEVSHLLTALLLMLKVHEIKIFPTIGEKEIRLGRVLYERKDPIRGILVGVAPLFVGLLAFFLLAYFKLFPSENIFLNVLIGYLVFTISSSMFSSKQDLVDLLYLIPFFIIIAGMIYVFNVKIEFAIQNKEALAKLASAFSKINFFLFISLVINVLCIFFLKILQSLGRK